MQDIFSQPRLNHFSEGQSNLIRSRAASVAAVAAAAAAAAAAADTAPLPQPVSNFSCCRFRQFFCEIFSLINGLKSYS